MPLLSVGLGVSHRLLKLMSAVAALAVVISGLQTLLAHPARAHGGTGVLDVETDVSGSAVVFDVGVTYETDGEPAERAIVEATGTGPEGAVVEAFPLQRNTNGRYVGSTTVPGDGNWQFVIESSFPPGSTKVAIDVGGRSASDDAAAWWPVVVVAAVAAVGAATFGLRRRQRARST